MSSLSKQATESEAATSGGQAVRSENLLPADDSDENLHIAEEVAFDLQSDQARRVGSMPPDDPVSQPATAVAESISSTPLPSDGGETDAASG